MRTDGGNQRVHPRQPADRESLEIVDLASVPNSFSDPAHSLYIHFDALRERAPAVCVRGAGESWYSFLRADTAKRILADTDTFRTFHPDLAASGYFDDELLPASKDPPEHQKYRRLIQGVFSPRAVKALEPRMREHARALIEPLRPRGECEFIAAFAQPYPTRVFIDVMGFPEQGLDELLRHERDFWTAADRDPEGHIRGGALNGLRAYVKARLEHVRREPDRSMLSILTAARIDDRLLTDDEIVSYGVLACIGGIHTTRSLLGKIFCHLAREPSDRARLRAEPALIPRFVDEALRIYAIGESFRFAARDVAVDGVELRRGDKISVNWPAVNRDPREFADPTRLHLDGPAPKHLGFGYGPHFCIGMHLARTDVAIAIEEWLRLIPPFEVDSDLDLREQVWGGAGLDSLPLFWVP
jgi:cytochrome P450